MLPVSFNYADVKPIRLEKKGVVKRFIADIFIKEGKELQFLNYIFCSDGYLLRINKSFLNHNYYTDIISFDLSESGGIVGEIYVSIDRVTENARTHSTRVEAELLRVLFHGALHLCGYKDKKKSEIIMMRQKEEYYLQHWIEKV